jgi:hypothetical protein
MTDYAKPRDVEQFAGGVVFHGTRAPFRKGGWLFPRSFYKGLKEAARVTTAPVKPGRQPSPDADKWVYVTTNEALAWVYAWHAPGRGKPRVLIVQPYGPIERDPEHSVDMEAYRCPMAKVLDVDREPTVSEEDARAGWVEA